MTSMRLLPFIFALLLFSGCMSFNDDYFDPVTGAMRAQMPEITLEREMAMNFGSGFFNFVDLASLGEVDIPDMENLRIAIYRVEPQAGYPDFPDSVFKQALDSQGDSLEWERIVRVREEGEQVWVFAGMDLRAQILDALCVFILQRDELVLINMEGEIEQLIDYALNTGRKGSRSG